MANSVGSVSIDLEARIAKFESDLGRAARVAEQRSNEMRRTLGSIAAVLGAGISIAGITSFVKSALDSQDAISKMSQKVGVSTEALSGWQLAAKQAGVENEGFAKGLVKLSQSAAMVLQGSKQQVDAFKSIGVSVTDSTGHLRDMDKLFPEVIDKLSKFRDGTAKTAVATQIFGRAGAELIPLINAGAKGLAEYTKMAEDFGLVVGSKSAKAAEEFNDHLEQLSFVSKGVANQLATSLAPALADLATKAVSFFRSNRWKETLADISTGAKYVADHVEDIINAVKLLGQIVATVYVGKLLKLGTDWIGSLKAQGFMVDALGAKTQINAWASLKNMGLIKSAFTGVTAALIGWQIGTYLYNQFQIVRDGAAIMIGAVLTGWEMIKAGAKLNFIGMSDAWTETIFKMQEVFYKFQQGIASVLKESTVKTLHDAGVKMEQSIAQKQVDAATVAFQKINQNAKDRIKIEIDTAKKIKDIRENTWSGVGAPPDKQGPNPLDGPHKTTNQLNLVNEAAKAATAALDAYNKKQAELSAKAATAVAGYIGKTETPDVKAWNEYAGVVQKVAEAEGQRIQTAIDAQKAGVAGIDIAKVEASAQRDTASAIDQLAAARDKNIAAAEKQMAVGTRMADQALQEASLAGMTERDAAIARAGMQAANQLQAEGVEIGSKYFEQQKAIAEQGTATAFDLQKQMAFQKQVAQEFAGFWENASSSVSKAVGDLVVSGLRKWKDFGAGLKSIAKQFVSDIISQFIRLRVLGPLLSGVMGSVGGFLGIAGGLGASSLTQAANYYGGGSTISGSPNATGGSNSYGNMLSNISSAKSAYSYLFSGGTAAGASSIPAGMSGATYAGNAGANIGGSFGGTAGGFYAPGSQTALGATYGTAPVTPYGGYIGNSGMTYAGAGGALAGAYWGSQRGSGGFSTVASTGIGAIGGYYAGTAIATGMTAGVTAGLAAIPVVGWIALAAMLVDQVSGGKLFGTKYQATVADQMVRLTSGGAEASSTTTEKKQSALFGGAKWRTKNHEVSPELQKAADQLYGSIERSMVQGARQLGVEMPGMIDASMDIQSHIKKGKVTSTDYIVDYLGQTWKEATAEAAQQRIGAEALISVVQASAGAVAQTIAQQWRDSAETLADGAQLMLAAQTGINRGNELVALGTTATLSQVVSFVQGMQADGEKLADTYNRLAQASASYLQFVGQFEPAGVGFAYTMQQINKTMLANIDQANQLGIAAGMQGAREEDLANIHKYAAQQAADAIAALSAASQDLSTKLYGTVQSLASATAITAQLTSKLQASTQIAIGDNSPLNDKAKLDIALKGLRSGITSADDVLALGRKLYASSADYTGLYNKVTDILGLSKATGGSDDLSAALTNYNKLSAQATASSRFGDAKQLAQNISDISSVQGIDYSEIAKGLGVDLGALAKDLGLTNIASYLDSLKQEDVGQSVMSSSATIVDAIRGIGHDIVAAILGGPVVTPGPTGIKNAGSTNPDQSALLAKLSAQLDQVIQHTGDTANTNKTMVHQGVTSDLRSISGSTRGISA